jgi:hypothetical protein
MRHSHTSRISAKTLLAVVGFGLLGACADSVSSPTAEISAKNPAGFNTLVGTTTFLWTPGQGVTKRFGNHLIVIPAGAICDPSTATYGLGHWDEACAPATRSIVITALSFTDAGGHPYVDFQPALRFVPTKEVYLYMRDGVRDGSKTLTISYCSTPLTCTDESKNDPSLVTHRVGNSRILYRRLKHFSGYVVATSGDCSGSVEQLEDGTLFCNTDGGRGGESRSGYVVASGLGKTSTGDTFGGHRRRADK